MSKRLSLYTVLVCTAFCSSAFAVQPSIRAGSISLNNGAKPNANAITPTQGSAVNTARSASVPKFSTAIVPVTTQQNSNSVSSAALESLRQEIDRLRGELTSARVELEQNQITRNDIEEQINELDLTKTNTDLKNALAELERQNQEATEVLDSIQTQTARFTDSINTDIDNSNVIKNNIEIAQTIKEAGFTQEEAEALVADDPRLMDFCSKYYRLLSIYGKSFKDPVCSSYQDPFSCGSRSCRQRRLP